MILCVQGHQNRLTVIRVSQKEKYLSQLLYRICGFGSFSSMLFAFRNLLLIAKKSLSSFEDEITVEDKHVDFPRGDL